MSESWLLILILEINWKLLISGYIHKFDDSFMTSWVSKINPQISLICMHLPNCYLWSITHHMTKSLKRQIYFLLKDWWLYLDKTIKRHVHHLSFDSQSSDNSHLVDLLMQTMICFHTKQRHFLTFKLLKCTNVKMLMSI